VSYPALTTGELPSGALFFAPRYVVKVVNDLYNSNESLTNCRAWAANPPDWVKKKSKLGQDSYRLACFIRARLAHRFPTSGAADLAVPDSDASLIIQTRWMSDKLTLATLADWSVNPPNWSPWNPSQGNITRIIMPAVLWARRVGSERAGVDIPFFIDSTVEEVADIVVEENQALFLGAFELICNIAASLGISAGMSAAQATGKVAEAATEDVVVETAKAAGKKVGKKVVEKGTAKGIKAGATALVATSDRTTDKAISAGASATAAAGVAVVGALIAGGPIGWVGIGALAAAPFLCWAATEAIAEMVKANLRDWMPDLVPTLIRAVYKRVFGSTPSNDQVAELDKRYAGLISANSIAKAVGSPENDPRIINAVIRRQDALRAEIIRAIALHRPGCVPDEKLVAELADAAFNKTWTPMDINGYVLVFKDRLCPPPPTIVPDLRVVTINMRAPQLSRISVKAVGPAIVGKAKPILLSGLGSSSLDRQKLLGFGVLAAVVFFVVRRRN
jgi:hypothetical protein